MDKLKINLIPPEIKEKAKKEAKRSLVNKISIGFLGVLIAITVGVLSVIVYQNITLQNLNRSIEDDKAQIGAMKDKEAVVYFLKNRIDSITKFSATQFTQSQIFETITGLFPEGIALTNLQIDKSNKVVVLGETYSTDDLNTFLNNLTDPKVNDGRISTVTVESLSKSQDGSIKFSLTLNLAKI